MSAKIGPRKILRAVAAFAILTCGGLWAWSYHRPLGIARVDDDCLIADSARGSVVITRCYFPDRTYVITGAPSGTYVFATGCMMDDFAALADAAWLGRRYLGFGFGVGKPPSPTDKVWVLDENGTPVETTESEIAYPTPARPPHKHHQFAIVIPWWSITLGVSVTGLVVWRRAKPKYVGFPVSTKSTDA